MKRIRKAVIPAAGFGTRFLPATKATPKEMLPIVDKPTIQYIVEEAISSGIEDILIISGHAKRAIEDHFDSAPILEAELKAKGKTKLLEMVQETSEINVHYIRQKHMRGLGDAILCARAFIDNEPFAVLLGDDIVYNPEMPALKQLMDMYNQTGATILGCQQVPNDMIEKPSIEEAPSQMAVLGRYIITPDVFEVLQNTKPGKGGEIQLTDALKVMAKRENVYAYNFTGKRYDVGDKLGFLKATVEFALRRDDLFGDFAEYLKTIVKDL